jgi:hypothetical protein
MMLLMELIVLGLAKRLRSRREEAFAMLCYDLTLGRVVRGLQSDSCPRSLET